MAFNINSIFIVALVLGCFLLILGIRGAILARNAGQRERSNSLYAATVSVILTMLGLSWRMFTHFRNDQEGLIGTILMSSGPIVFSVYSLLQEKARTSSGSKLPPSPSERRR